MFKVYIGWDRKDVLAYEVCVASLLKHSTIPLEIIPLHEWKLRYRKLYYRSYIVDESGQSVDRRDRSKFSTDFSFTRFLVPAINEYKDEWVLFCDPDIMWRGDIGELVACIDNTKSVMCVAHEHVPYEKEKLFGLQQTKYVRKNWSSVMLLNTARCSQLTVYTVNNQSGDYLHSMKWVQDSEIGALSQEWNYLVGYTNPQEVCNPKVVHYTLGTPDIVAGAEYEDEWLDYAKDVHLYGTKSVRTTKDRTA